MRWSLPLAVALALARTAVAQSGSEAGGSASTPDVAARANASLPGASLPGAHANASAPSAATGPSASYAASATVANASSAPGAATGPSASHAASATVANASSAPGAATGPSASHGASATVANASSANLAHVASTSEPSDLDGEAAPRGPEVTRGRRALAIGAAIVPGVLVRGAGSWLVGQRRAARQLFGVAALGAAIGGVAGGLVGATGGNPYTIVPGVPIAIAGGGLFLTSWFADIYVAAGGTRSTGVPRARPPWSIETGLTWQHDAFRERALARGAARVELGRVGVGGGGLVDIGGDAKIVDGDVRVRLRGAPATGEVIASGARLVARAGARWHEDDVDRVSQLVGELELLGRLDLGVLERALAASFVELSTGLGVVRVRYADARRELDSLLLGRFAWGAYLGRRGEAALFYDHRRDGIAGGLPAWRAAGFLGSVGATVDVRVWGPWAVRGELEIGNAWVTTLAVGYRGGPP